MKRSEESPGATPSAVRAKHERRAFSIGDRAEIIATHCVGCGHCVVACPRGAITMERKRVRGLVAVIDQSRCVGCGACLGACHVEAIELP